MVLYRTLATQEEIDAQYDVERAVPDFGPYADFFVGRSAYARASLPCALDVRFGPTRDEYVDIFPASQPGAPVLVFIHGGYWRMLSAKEFSLVALGLAPHNVTVVITNYALCPKVTIDEITRQSRAAIAWLGRKAVQYNGDPSRIHVAGHSAGGQQVGMLLATDWNGEYGLPQDIVKSAVAISGLFDLSPFPYSWLQPKLLLTHETIRRQSPLFHLGPSPARLLVTLGGDESPEFHRQSQEYLGGWTACGNRGSAFEQPGRNHFTAIYDYADPAAPLTRATLDLMHHAPVAAPALAASMPAAKPKPVEGGPVPTYGQAPPRLSFERDRT